MLATAILALALVAPSRVALPIAGGELDRVEGAVAGTAAVALPDGGARLLAALDGRRPALLQLSATGSVVARGPALTLPGDPDALLSLPDGRFLATTVTSPDNQVAVVRLRADGSLDQTYGEGGVARPGIEVGCVNCDDAAVAPDGSLVVGGSRALRWVVARLGPAGALDAGFGDGGIATLPGQPATASGVGLLADGRVATMGRVGPIDGPSQTRIARLSATGALEAPATATPLGAAFAWLAHADGAVDVAGQPARGGAEQLMRYDSAGVLRTTTELGAVDSVRLLEMPAGGVLAFGFPTGQGPVGVLEARFVHADGSIDDALTRRLGMPLLGALIGDVLRRPDGGFLVVGGAGIERYTGEGDGFNPGAYAVTALTGELTLDTRFGGHAATPGVRVRLAPQRARTVRARRRLSVIAAASAPSIIRITGRIGTARRFTLTLPVARGGKNRYAIPLDAVRGGVRAGALVRAARPGARVRLRATVRDLVLSTATATASGHLG